MAVIPAMPANASADHGAHLRVMTQNLYLGSSLAPALTATSQTAFVAAVAQIYRTVQYTDFPARAEAIADEIDADSPDLVGLQEVTNWTTTGVNRPPGYDFLAILQAALHARGLAYTVAAVAENASIGPVPLALPGCVQPGPTITCTVKLNDRDVILVNDRTPRLSWNHPRSGRYQAQEVLTSPAGTLSFDRGWASIEARLNGRHFRFTTTHLETEDFPATQQAQAAEFLAGPGRGGTIIAVGDFNSAADGSTTTSYRQLTAPGRFRDAWNERLLGPGSSCCQVSNTPPLAPGALNNPISTLRTRIDLILSRGAARSAGDTAIVGDKPFRSTPPLWPSDHAGVIAEIRL
ncbi:MAG TPA: endonuclease/exonuclease/phosphatase family protein [Microlunatus sp.]|nr:endonuclease/exonuclease/phosphatase family protein [Microlunatus sp.]